jgi:phosphopantothenoylcysteine decarboxylase/phosphopantothenate--cysteine ligase
MPEMDCIVTAGPTYEPLDAVRRLTNLSTGRLGCELANFLVARGHRVTLLIGQMATWRSEPQAQRVEAFSTGADLAERLQRMAGQPVDAVFHAAAVSDFAFGKVWQRLPGGELIEVSAGKLPSASGELLAELAPTPKILHQLRGWFPPAFLAGWKYEVQGDRAAVLAKAEGQMRENQTDACVANGPAYGAGFGLLSSNGQRLHFDQRQRLFAALEKAARTARRQDTTRLLTSAATGIRDARTTGRRRAPWPG